MRQRRLEVPRARGRAGSTHPEISCPSVSGTASWRCVRPILTMSRERLGLPRRACRASRRTAGTSRPRICSTAAMCMAVGKVSFDDWLLLTSSFGWTSFFEPERPAEELDRAVGDDLVGVHVGLGAAAGLPDHQREVVVEPARRSPRRPPGRWRAPCPSGRSPRSRLTSGARLLEDAEGADHLAREALAADPEVLERALGLGAPVAVGGNLDRAPSCRARCESVRAGGDRAGRLHRRLPGAGRGAQMARLPPPSRR